MAAKQIQEGLAALFGLASGKGRPVPYVTPPDPSPEQMKAAQEAAARPKEEGGLGLPPDNTPVQRAQAMGAQPFYHGSANPDIKELDPDFTVRERVGSGSGIFGARRDNPELAETYVPAVTGEYKNVPEGGAVYPLVTLEEGRKIGQIDFGGAAYDRGEDLILTLPDGREVTPPGMGGDIEDYRLGIVNAEDLKDLAKDYGLDGINISNVMDVGGKMRPETTKALKERGYIAEDLPDDMKSMYDVRLDYRSPGGEEAVVYDVPVRSPNAAFNPDLRDSKSLTAEGGSLVLGAAGVGSVMGDALEYLQRNLDPRTIADYGLATLAVIPSPLALPAAATELGLFALDSANALLEMEKKSKAGQALESESRGGQMKRGRKSKKEDTAKFANGGIVEVIKKQRRQLLDD
jgi:hypothetical protein